MTTTNTKNLIDTYKVIYDKAEERMQKAKNAEEKAFYFGHMNLTATLGAAIIGALNDNTNAAKITVNWDYKDALKEYNDANEKLNKDQISMEDIVPGILASIEEVIDATIKKHYTQSKSTKKSTTKTTKSKKE